MTLLDAAREARDRSYSPYSSYKVGSALIDENGATHVGTNVESASYGATICAERSAISAMIVAGGRRIREIVVVTQDGGSPCGICRQVLAEFADPDCPVTMVAADGVSRISTVGALLPDSFSLRTREGSSVV